MVGASPAPVVAILTRAPASGGKTRLFTSLGVPTDPVLLTALLLDTLDGAAAPGVRRVIAVTPPEACDDVRRIAGGVEVMPQPAGDLGDRMRGVMTALFAGGAPAVAVIGSDVPHLPPATVVEAFSRLSRDPGTLVLGPAADGGYYLLASTRVPEVFAGIEWGSARARAQTEAAAAKDGFTVHHLATMSDVDSADDLRRACASGRGRRTAEWARGNLQDGLK
jgi:rSAM/selenodomain-associated transferase 1